MEQINAIGRRKAAVARVYLSKGSGTITVNGKTYKEYFPHIHMHRNIEDPFATVGVEEAYGMAISRALVKLNEEFRSPLKSKKYLTRDSRAVERKKYGKPKARKSFQFSKR